jgi:hypothetical protein
MSQKTAKMYKRPSKRVRCPPIQNVGKPPEGSFLHGLLKKTEVVYEPAPRRPVYRQDDYLKLLEKNNTQLGIPFVPPNLPEYVPDPPPVQSQEPELDVPDRVYLKLRVLKNGIVRVKLSATIWDLHETYYRQGKKPPFKAVLQAYKGHGFSKEFLEKLKKSQEKQKALAQRIDKVFTKIFDKEPVKKVKKKVEKKEEDEHEPEPDEDEEDDPIEDGGMDVEPDMDDEEVVEDEEFLSDGE